MDSLLSNEEPMLMSFQDFNQINCMADLLHLYKTPEQPDEQESDKCSDTTADNSDESPIKKPRIAKKLDAIQQSRMEKNRESAQHSRNRKKAQFDSYKELNEQLLTTQSILQEDIIELKRENAALKKLILTNRL
jgi:hypothetical protein